jgi:hypothetical protein
LIEHPFAELRQPLAQAKPWCSILILHLNVKYCRPGSCCLSPPTGAGCWIAKTAPGMRRQSFTGRPLTDARRRCLRGCGPTC